MIRYSELQIGDWVLVQGKPRKVEAITKRKIGYHVTPTDQLHYARLPELEPIPITKEILKSSGFVENLCYWDYHIDENTKFQYYFHEHRLERQWYGRDEWENHRWLREVTLKINCYELHELQQVFRRCGVEIIWKI